MKGRDLHVRVKSLLMTVAASGALAGGGAALASSASASASASAKPKAPYPLHARRVHAPNTGTTGGYGMGHHCPGMGGASSGNSGSAFQPGPGGPPGPAPAV
jgi:hypothetical protein